MFYRQVLNGLSDISGSKVCKCAAMSFVNAMNGFDRKRPKLICDESAEIL